MAFLKKKNFLEIYKINLGRTCFDRVSRKSETNNIFFRPYGGNRIQSIFHLNFFRQLKKTTEVLPLLRVLFLDTPGHPMNAPQYRNSTTVAKTPYKHITIRNLGIASGLLFLCFFFQSLRGGQGRT